MTELSREERYLTINRVNWICTVVDAVLSVFKLTIGILARSPALIADALHSLSDLFTDILALILGRLAKDGPDEDHPYGHARYETVGTAILGTVLIMVAVGIAADNVNALIQQNNITPHWITLVAVVVSIISKEGLFHYTMKYARLTRSNLLEANAWHSRSDSLSSIVVFVGVLFTFAGFPLVEYLAALVVAVLIGKMGASLAWNAMQDLIDRGVDLDQQQLYIDSLNQIDDIIDVHSLRTRIMGSDVFIDAHIQVSPTISVSEAHQINDFATIHLETKHPEVKDVTLHIDFEPDHRIKKTQLEPLRQKLNQLLDDCDLPKPDRMYIHYDSNQVDVELVFFDDVRLQTTNEKCKELTQKYDWINSIKLLKNAD